MAKIIPIAAPWLAKPRKPVNSNGFNLNFDPDNSSNNTSSNGLTYGNNDSSNNTSGGTQSGGSNTQTTQSGDSITTSYESLDRGNNSGVVNTC